MLTQSKYFGEISYLAEDVLRFPEGLFGFEDEQDFLLLPFEGGDGNLLCLQSLKTPALAFVAVNPFSLNPSYAPLLPEKELKALGVRDSRELCYYVFCVVRNPIGESTVNLRCPLVINDESKLCLQTILDSSEYHMKHLLSDFSAEEESSPC